MPRERAKRANRSGRAADLALELRTSALSFEQITKSLTPSICQRRAFRILQKARRELAKTNQKTAEQARMMLIRQLELLRIALSPNSSDPRTVDTLLTIHKQLCELRGLDGPPQIDGRQDSEPMETEESRPDLSKLTLEELDQLDAIERKIQRESPSVIGFKPRTVSA